MPGHFAIILHAHLPFVRHPEHEDFLEEDWFFEAVTESYIPLLRMMRRLVNDSVPFKLTMSLTPTLCAMLQDQLLRERYMRHLDLLIDLTGREQKRNCNHPLLRSGRSRLTVWNAAPVPVDLCAVLYACGSGRVCTRWRFKPASMERA